VTLKLLVHRLITVQALKKMTGTQVLAIFHMGTTVKMVVIIRRRSCLVVCLLLHPGFNVSCSFLAAFLLNWIN